MKKVAILYLLLQIACISSIAQNKISTDTIPFTQLYYEINPCKNKSITYHIPKEYSADSNMTKMRFFDDFDLEYIYYEDYTIGTTSHKEYFLINGNKFIMHDWYYKEEYEGVTFRSNQTQSAFKVEQGIETYISVFLKNTSIGMFEGTILFLFYNNGKDKKLELLYKDVQLAEDSRCFRKTDKGDVLYYEWKQTEGNFNHYYTIYRLKNNTITKQSENPLSIIQTGRYTLKILKKSKTYKTINKQKKLHK